MEILKSLGHPDEVLALMKFKIGGCDSISPKDKDVSIFFFIYLVYRSLDATPFILNQLIWHYTCGQLRHYKRPSLYRKYTFCNKKRKKGLLSLVQTDIGDHTFLAQCQLARPR